jgi:cellobiose-specific phosphotransferase system component IIA
MQSQLTTPAELSSKLIAAFNDELKKDLLTHQPLNLEKILNEHVSQIWQSAKTDAIAMSILIETFQATYKPEDLKNKTNFDIEQAKSYMMTVITEFVNSHNAKLNSIQKEAQEEQKKYQEELKAAQDLLLASENEIKQIDIELLAVKNEFKSPDIRSIKAQLTHLEIKTKEAKTILDTIKNTTTFGAIDRAYLSFFISGVITIALGTAFPSFFEPVSIKLLTGLFIGSITGTNSYLGWRAEKKQPALTFKQAEEKYVALNSAFIEKSKAYEKTNAEMLNNEVKQCEIQKRLKAAEKRVTDATILIAQSTYNLEKAITTNHTRLSAFTNSQTGLLFFANRKKEPLPLFKPSAKNSKSTPETSEPTTPSFKHATPA